MEETVAQEQTNETVQEATTKPESSWHWNEDVGGAGDAPEWFKTSKYKTVADQAKAYVELEKKFGGFSGSPEQYQFDESLGLGENDPLLNELMPLFKEGNASNEFVGKVVEKYLAVSQELNEQRYNNEMKSLGENADYRIKAIESFAKSNIPLELLDTFNGMVNSANSVRVIETLMSRFTGAAVAPSATVAAKDGMTAASLRDMLLAKNENGQLLSSLDPQYKAKVDSAYREFYGK